MSRPRTKRMVVTLRLRAPHWMTGEQAAREVRTLINHQCNFMSGGPNLEEFEVRASKVLASRMPSYRKDEK